MDGMRRTAVVLMLSLGLGCAPSLGRLNPAVDPDTSIAPTLLTATVSCLDSHQVASGGARVRRATAIGPDVVQSLNRRLARIGDGTPPMPQSLCRQLTSPNAADPDDWSHPPMPPTLTRVIEMSGAQSVMVPVVHSTMRCEGKSRSWRWGEPAYSDEGGSVDCHEHQIALGAFVYDRSGRLFWKAYDIHKLSAPLDAAAAADELLRGIPVSDAVPLGGRGVGPSAPTAPARDPHTGS